MQPGVAITAYDDFNLVSSVFGKFRGDLETQDILNNNSF